MNVEIKDDHIVVNGEKYIERNFHNHVGLTALLVCIGFLLGGCIVNLIWIANGSFVLP
ncbi:hypothetical protein QTV43_000365 [Vibrio vulnificus]|nr:hypothetical protein [Vibrio vulnificus]